MAHGPAGRFSARVALDAAWVVTSLVATTPFVLFPGSGLGPTERAAAAGLVALTLWRPADAMLALVALAPLGPTLGALAGWRVPVLSWSVPAVLIGGALALLARRLPMPRARAAVTAPVLVLAWLALASVAAQVVRDRVRFETAAEWQHAARAFLDPAALNRFAPWRRADAGEWLAQQVLLVPLVAAAVSRPGPSRIAAMLSIGAAAAGLVNVHRALVVAGRAADGWTHVAAVAGAERVSAAFPDVNAAGSFFALAVAASGGLLVEAWRKRHWAGVTLWSLASLASAAALWLSGSRVALAAGALALVCLSALGARGGLTLRRLAALVLIAATTVALLLASNARRKFDDVPVAWLVRVEFVKTTWAMLQDHPVFGVGAGNYLPASTHYSSPALKRYYPAQNAHNNYLQVAGELGPVALAALLLLTIGPVVDVARRLRSGQVPPATPGLWCGVLAFVLTFAAGHPLLIPEVAVAFFLALGGLASVRADADAPAAGRRAVWVVTAVGAFVVLSFPGRLAADRAALDLEHIILSGQRWVRGAQGPEVPFKESIDLFVPAGDGKALVRLQAPRTRRPVLVSLFLETRLVNEVRLAGGDWVSVDLRVPRTGSRRFRLLRLQARYERPGGRPATPTVVLRRIDWVPAHDAGAATHPETGP